MLRRQPITKGTYTIVIACIKPIKITFGSLGSAKTTRGFYTYTGSALGKGAVSLEGRIHRHLSRRKKNRWHADYIASRRFCTVRAAVYVQSSARIECAVNKALAIELKARPLIPHIGASDCKCDGHLLQIPSTNETILLERIQTTYSEYAIPVNVITKSQLRSAFLPPTSSEKRL